MSRLAAKSLLFRLLAFVMGIALSLSSTTPARGATQIVTLCGRDDAPGGLNLAAAIAVGGDIVIRCPSGPQTIEFTRTLDAHGIVNVDGEGKIILRGPVAGPLFTADIALNLSGLTVENPRTPATATAPGAGMIILGPTASIELDHVTTQDSLAAYVVQSFTARNSRFQRNGDPAAQGAFTAVVSAEMVELTNVAFTGNFDHPIAGGLPPGVARPPLSRSINIEDSVFTGNHSTLLLTDARISIRRTRFEANGTAPDKSGGAWGCCGGAITLVQSDADLSDTEFRGNATSGFGGAIYALGSKLRIERSLFEGNQARAGGAVMFWGRRPKVNIWSSGPWRDSPRLELRRTQFRGNTSTALGGALLFAGTVVGNAVLFQANLSGSVGGAITDWSAAELPDPYGGVFPALVDASEVGPPDSIALARPIVLDNIAVTRGAALAVSSATVAIGNGLIARNQVKTASGGAVVTAKLTVLVNTTVADNPAGGLVAAPGGTLHLGNSVVLRNTNFNCSLSGGNLVDLGSNLQFPGNDCGSTLRVRDPGLDERYAPGLVSAARGAGNIGMCAADPQVQGVDLWGKPRLEAGRCDVGAIEQPLRKTLASDLGLGSGNNAVTRMLWLFLLLVLLLFVLILFWIVRRRRPHLDAGAGSVV